MDWDEERLLSLEVDVNYGLAPNSGGLPALLKDPTVLAVYAWSPRARLLALGSGIAHGARMNGWDQAYSPGRPPDPLVRLAESLEDQAPTARSVRTPSRTPLSSNPPTTSWPPPVDGFRTHGS
ncbi:hypothetical protein ACFT8W_05980 [Streptomyces hygroscopicus]|uniref:hypothetical protein n=1 Tax=Streptomyces hygroscopicus TaxID=1912 RepID=UPI0036451B0E